MEKITKIHGKIPKIHEKNLKNTWKKSQKYMKKIPKIHEKNPKNPWKNPKNT